MARPLLFDTTALVAALRHPARLPALRRAALSQRSFLTAVTIAELHVGARSPQQAAVIDQLAMLFERHERLLTPTTAEWAAAGRLIARASARHGAMQARDHYPDVLIAQMAGRIGAVV
jgi:predicted nucleic acid-binding protein